MKQYLKCYQVVMRTVGPVFVGSGKEIMKKEYLFLDRKKAVGIPDIRKLYAELRKRNKGTAFEEYLLGWERSDLTQWLGGQRIRPEDLRPLLKYTLDCGDAILEGGSRLQIMECIKDAYGKPYIPGSSLKGMFRTILLGADIIKNPEKYQEEKSRMRQEATDSRDRRNYYLKNSMAGIENKAYRVLNRTERKPTDAVNDLMQGFIVSDSEPLSTDDLVLCQKIDRHTDGTEKRLPMLRECIKPGTEIRFTITIDTNTCRLSDGQLKDAVKLFVTSYYRNFSKAFTGMEVPGVNYVLCGGGCGFVSKTIIYPMYGKPEGIEMAQRVFEHTVSDKVKREHKHYLDKKYGASPHTIKCTRYRGKLLQMGVCRIEKIESI